MSMSKNGELIVDASYQRRSVWGEKDRIRLIETILLNLVVPSIYFWNAETDPDTGRAITHIVDGQQRIDSIKQFVNGELKLKKSFLLDDNIRDLFGNKKFNDLPAEEKKNFWEYKLSVIEIERNVDSDDIKDMFKRLNLTDYNLNSQEKRNAISGEFASLAKELSEHSFWTRKDMEIFRGNSIKRMQDVEFCASLILLCKRGIIDQTTDKALNEAYTDYESNYDEADQDRETILQAIENANLFINNETLPFIRRTSQLYTVFSLIFYLMRRGIDVDEKIVARFKQFVILYDNFINEENVKLDLTKNEQILYDQIKKYKQASSEGTRKQVNRMARFEVLKNFVLDDGMEGELVEELNQKLLQAK